MSNKASLEKAIEIFAMISLPVALVVGCEGTLKQRNGIDKSDEIRAIEQSYNMDEIYPLFSTDGATLAVNEILQTVAEEKKDKQADKVLQPVVVHTEVRDDTVLVSHEIQDSLMQVSFIEPVSEVVSEEKKTAQTAGNIWYDL